MELGISLKMIAPLFIAIFIIFAVVLIIFYISTHRCKRKTIQTLKPIPEPISETQQRDYYKKRKYIVTERELKFFRELKPIADKKRVLIFSKVRLADLIAPCAEQGTEQFIVSFNKIKAKHIDFVLCDNAFLNPLLAIELDDSTHERHDRQQRDKFVNYALETAGIPIIHVYNSQGLEDKISNAIDKQIAWKQTNKILL